MARFGRRVRIDKKGAIDLVTEVDVAVESWFRELISARFPTIAILAEEFDAPASAGRAGSDAASAVRTEARRHRWIFDPIDGTTNYAHGLPIFCASLALEIDGESKSGAVYDPTRRELFTAERGQGAFLNGAAAACIEADDAPSTRCSARDFRTTCTRRRTRWSGFSARS